LARGCALRPWPPGRPVGGPACAGEPAPSGVVE